MHPRIIPVILAGGFGERLWPLSTRDFPKQFLSFDASGRSLFQQTLARVADRAQFAAPIIVCNALHRFIVTEQLNAIACDDATVIVEPHARNTAPAILLAALHAVQLAPDALLLVLPSDHRIENPAALLTAVEHGKQAAQDGRFVTFACTPTAPETGYGYIEIGESLTVDSSIRRIISFTEKPDRACAETYIASGQYGWNSGIFLFVISALLAAFEQIAPTKLSACATAYTNAARDVDFILPDAAAFVMAPAQSIDVALMEKTDRGAVIPVAMGWSDLGSWNALAAIAHDVQNSVERPWGRFELIARGAQYQMKKLHVKPGGKISLQRHVHRSEHWVVVTGRATVTNGDAILSLAPQQSTYIPAGAVHQLENREAVPLVVIEVQTGSVLDEADITRLEDVYNRA